MRPRTIGTLAKASGVRLETERYYERISRTHQSAALTRRQTIKRATAI